MIHIVGGVVLAIVFAVGTTRPINLGALSLAATFLVGTFMAGEGAREMASGFPVDLFFVLTGVTYLFAIAANNGTVGRVVDGAVRLSGARRALIPWAVFVIASLPAMAGALGSAGVALLAPFSMRLAERCAIDRRLIGLMVVHGASAGNFSPLNVLGAIVQQSLVREGLTMSPWALFVANLGYNVGLAAITFVIFGGLRLRQTGAVPVAVTAGPDGPPRRLSTDQIATLVAIVAVGITVLVYGTSIGFLALTAAVALQLAFPRSSAGAESKIAWGVVLLVCGVVTYVAALQRYGTVDALGQSIAGLGRPLLTAFLICAVGAITSAFASSAGILGAMIPLAVPFMAQGEIGTTGLILALAISTTVVDSTPFSTVGALVVANASDHERLLVYRGLLKWGLAMVVTAPLITWLLFIWPAS